MRARARASARGEVSSRARDSRNQSHALNTHSNAIARDRARRANDTRIDSFAPTRAFAFSATARDSTIECKSNEIQFDSIDAKSSRVRRDRGRCRRRETRVRSRTTSSASSPLSNGRARALARRARRVRASRMRGTEGHVTSHDSSNTMSRDRARDVVEDVGFRV